jgi:hypothetical protein
MSSERGFNGVLLSALKATKGKNNLFNTVGSEAAERRLVEKREFAAAVGMFLTVGAPGAIEALSKDPVAFTVAGKISNRGSQIRMDISNGLH